MCMCLNVFMVLYRKRREGSLQELKNNGGIVKEFRSQFLFEETIRIHRVHFKQLGTYIYVSLCV